MSLGAWKFHRRCMRERPQLSGAPPHQAGLTKEAVVSPGPGDTPLCRGHWVGTKPHGQGSTPDSQTGSCGRVLVPANLLSHGDLIFIY